jgi:hypothetical protein
MRRTLEDRNFFKQTNTDRITNLVNCYEGLCDVAYDSKIVHRSWVTFMGKTGHDVSSYSMDTNMLQFKSNVDTKIDYLVGYIEEGLDKLNQ